jgi:hypothetical protein
MNKIIFVLKLLYFESKSPMYFQAFKQKNNIGPSSHLSVVGAVGRAVVAERHAALRARDLELGVGAVEQPPGVDLTNKFRP